MRKRVFGYLGFILLYVYVLFRAAHHPETALLPVYALGSISRLLVTYVICLAFGLVVGIFAAMNNTAGDIIIPILDILQSVPVLGFFPFAILLVVPIFGFATASIILLFTSMAWSIVFGVIAGVKAIPQHIQDMASIFNLRGWPYIKHIILPSIYAPLIAGSILAFGSGWYFLIASEYVTYSTTTYTLPGLGYYLNMASFQYADIWMSLAGLMTIGLIVFCFHRLVWLRLDKSAKEAKFLNLHFGYERPTTKPSVPIQSTLHKHIHFGRRHAHQWFFNIFKFSKGIYILILSVILVGGTAIVLAARHHTIIDPATLLWLFMLSFTRIIIAYILAIVIAISIGYILMRNPRSRKVIMPIADVMQSIPALAYFPILYLLFTVFLSIGMTLELASILLLLSGMLWYLLFNVIEAVEHLPKDINEISQLYDMKGSEYVKNILLPAMFPALITGSILAFGGGWNAIIVAEYINIGGHAHMIPGVGAAMNSYAGTPGGIPTLIMILFCMTAIVLLMNHFVWRKLLNKASKYVLEED